MIRKLILAASAAAAITLPAAEPARAEVDIELTIHRGYGGNYGRNIKCWQAQNIVEYRFNNVRPRDCRGRTYAFTGKRKGKWYVIYVSSYTGRIVDVDRWYR